MLRISLFAGQKHRKYQARYAPFPPELWEKMNGRHPWRPKRQN
jgi:hypothetical protein